METEVIKTDVLCIGAGIAGLMAGIRSAELGADVVITDKATDPRFSGSGGLGNDHFQCYIPEVHGADIEPYIDELQSGQQGALRHRTFVKTWLERTNEMVQLWDEWGIPMKYKGRWEFAGHTVPGKPFMY
jgi:succinate dehydrogenase/fumarate reductase flavoprotein subunit